MVLTMVSRTFSSLGRYRWSRTMSRPMCSPGRLPRRLVMVSVTSVGVLAGGGAQGA